MMKTILLFLLLAAIGMTQEANAQFLKRLGKVAENAAKRTLENKVDEKTSKETDSGFDNVFNKKGRNKNKEESATEYSDRENAKESIEKKSKENVEEVYEVSRNFDFAAGSKVFFQDNFEKDLLGDFPAKWDTNGSGELVSVSGQKWLKLFGNATYIPIIPEKLPENYTIEFELLTRALDRNTSSQAFLHFIFDNQNGFNRADTKAIVSLNLVQYIEPKTIVERYESNNRIIRNAIIKDYRNTIKGKSRISIMVNKQRMRVWMNQEKIVDVPRLVPKDVISNFKLLLKNIDNKDEVYISNFRFAKTGQDNRSKLLTEGRLSTNAILFESASAVLKSESYAIIKEIAEVLQQNPTIKIKIIGHTDADGTDSNNLTLSKERADAVKNAMIYRYDISASRIITDGKGESIPVASNDTSEGKSQNRRVEFIKL